MTKKDYIAIASILVARQGNCKKGQEFRSMAMGLADYFSTQNKLFDRAKFLKACNIVD